MATEITLEQAQAMLRETGRLENVRVRHSLPVGVDFAAGEVLGVPVPKGGGAWAWAWGCEFIYEETPMAITPYDRGRAWHRDEGGDKSGNPYSLGTNDRVAWERGWLDEAREHFMATENDYRAGEQARNTGAAFEDNPHPADSAEAIVWRKGWNDKDREIKKQETAAPIREQRARWAEKAKALDAAAKPKVVQIVADHGVLHVLGSDGSLWRKVDGDEKGWQPANLPPGFVVGG